MPVGDAQAHNFVVGELARRALGRHLRRMQNEPNPAPPPTDDSSRLTNWWHQKTPWIRAVSNAVPAKTAEDGSFVQAMNEYADAQAVFGDEITERTRFHHILYGGVGRNVEDPKAIDTNPDGVNLQHNFEQLYNQPFNTDEPNRGNKPMPGITNANIQYKGGVGGSLKKASVNFNCYSLADLERLEKLYMYPGIKVLLEWGWSKNTKGTGFTHEQCDPIPLDDTILASPGAVHEELSIRRNKSGGCYDGMFGTITNFNWSIASDLSFNCRFDITDIGDSIFTISTNVSFQNSKVKDSEKESDQGFTLKKALEDIQKKLESSSKTASGTVQTKTINFKNTVGSIEFNYFRNKHGSPTKQHVEGKDKKGNIFRTYVRFGDIVDQLMNRLYIITSKSTRDDAANGSTKSVPIVLPHSSFSIGGAEIKTVDTGATNASGDKIDTPAKPVSVISNHPYLLSTDPDICLLPGQVGAAPYDVKSALSDSKRGGGHITSRSFPSGIDANSDLLFNCSNGNAAKINQAATENYDETKKKAGLLANIFVNLQMMKDICEQSATVGDFLRAVTDKLNNACGDIWAFHWSCTDEHPGVMTCMDMNFYWGGAVTTVGLPVANLSGIVKSLNMKSEINSNLASNLFIAGNTSFTGNAVEKSPLSMNTALPVAVDFTIDGISGLQFGTSFAIDYLPSRYRKQTYLSAQQVSHTISPGSWETAVTCMFKYAHPDNDMYMMNIGNVMNLQASDVGTDKDIACAIREEVNTSKDMLFEAQNEGKSASFPNGMFQSLESVGLTVGAPDGDPDKGKEVAAEGEERETIESLRPRLEDVMSKIYGKGTQGSSENLDNARALLQKILYLPVDGSAATPPPPEPPKAKTKRKKKKLKVVVRCDKGFEGCTGPPSKFHLTHNGELQYPADTYNPFFNEKVDKTYVAPTVTLKYRPTGIDIAAPGQTFIGPG